MNCRFYKSSTNLIWFSTIIYVFQLCLLGPNSSWENITENEMQFVFVNKKMLSRADFSKNKQKKRPFFFRTDLQVAV